MNSLFESLPYLTAYHPALLALALLCLAILIQAILNAPLGFASGEQEPGRPLKGSHEQLSFRVLRTYMNSVENYPAFIAAVLLAIIAGISPVWVNWLAGLHLAFRLAFWVVYYGGIGKVAGGPRTLAYVGGWLTNSILATMAVYTLLIS
ncbi:MAPEG family protein [Sphingorhabdus sp. Alg239-R122]|uniref:MAPEG family protein n=1 Tax=Sphingorhabdus sp. Alg239-R122 TaxID=2305989 RepID=UPI0013D92697|nr:MAPEG family protein [Sphingorhabdus sp. Alg239-R122]